MIIKILGPGCADCASLERITRQAVAELGIDVEIEKVAGDGIMSTLGLVVNDKVLLTGRVPTAANVCTSSGVVAASAQLTNG